MSTKLETKVQRELSPCFLGNLSYEFLYESIRKKDGAINNFYLRKECIRDGVCNEKMLQEIKIGGRMKGRKTM